MKKIDRIFFFGIVVISLIIHVVAYRVWLFSSGVLTQGDWILSLTNYSKTLLTYPLIWKSYSIGSMDFTPPFYPFLLLEGILSHLGVTYGYIERITFMWPIALLSIPLSYLLVKSMTKNPIAAFIGSLVYAYNTYFLILQSGQLTLMAAFVFTPLALLLFKYTIERKSFLYAVLTGLVSFVISFYEFRGFYILVGVLSFYYLYFIFFVAKKKWKDTLKKTFLLVLTPLIIVFLLNLYWIIPIALAPSFLTGSVLSRGLFGKELFNISRSLASFHPFWTGGAYYPFIVQPIPFYFFLYPLFAFLGLVLHKKNPTVVFFGLLALLGIFLTKQNNQPFPDIYVWMYSHIPGFGAFREASKFNVLLALGYAVLIGTFFDWVWENWKKGIKGVTKYLITIVAIGVLLLNMKPLLTGEFGTLFTPRVMPQDYLVINNFIDKQQGFFRTLWFPSDSRWGTNTNTHPKNGVINMLTATWKPFTDASKYPSIGVQALAFLKQDDARHLIDLTSFKYIIVPLEDKANDDNFYQFFFTSEKDYVHEMSTFTSFKKISLPLQKAVIYQNPFYRPHVYVTNEKESITRTIPYKTIPFTTINTTQYTLQLTHMSHPIYVNFTDNYNPGWNVHVGNFHWYDAFLQKGYFLSQAFHFENAATLNSFYLDPSYIKKYSNKNDYTVNKDGSINASVTLYFFPQSYMNFGGILTEVFLVVLLGYFVVKAKQYGK